MIIDWHTHVVPLTEAAAPHWQGRCPMTIETVLRVMEENEIDISVVSNPCHHLRHLDNDAALQDLKRWNDYAAQLQSDHEGRIICFTSTIPTAGDPFVREVERATRDLGLKGVFINSSHQGAYPDDDPAEPFFEYAERNGLPVMIHPPAIGFGEERMQDYRLGSSVGRAFDNCLALARMIVRGVFERHKELKLVASHLGGGICEIIGRMDYAYELGDDAFFLGKYEPMLITKRPSEYLKGIYLDTICYHRPALVCGLETVGVDQLIYGSDAPPLTKLKPQSLEVVRSLDLPDDAKAKILWRNAANLLGLESVDQRAGATETIDSVG